MFFLNSWKRLEVTGRTSHIKHVSATGSVWLSSVENRTLIGCCGGTGVPLTNCQNSAQPGASSLVDWAA